jgi:taurine dioxygenase
LPPAQSDALLDEVWRFMDSSEFFYEHHWRVGDLVLWDNRSTMHRRDPFDSATRRVMHRTQIKGKWRPKPYMGVTDAARVSAEPGLAATPR